MIGSQSFLKFQILDKIRNIVGKGEFFFSLFRVIKGRKLTNRIMHKLKLYSFVSIYFVPVVLLQKTWGHFTMILSSLKTI